MFCQMEFFKGQFSDLPVCGTNKGKPVVLDGDSAGFRDDFTAVRAYLVAPGKQGEIPSPPNVGPYVRYIEKSFAPWVVVEVFQEAISG